MSYSLGMGTSKQVGTKPKQQGLSPDQQYDTTNASGIHNEWVESRKANLQIK
jgi:hypothetical protein